MKTTTRIRGIANTLRALAIVLTLGGAILFLPRPWLDSVLVRFGLEAMPNAALAHYIQLGCGYLAISLGIMLWVVASHVARCRPLVTSILATFLVGAPAFYLMNLIAGMPRWCAITDFLCCLVGGGMLLVYVRWPATPSPKRGAAANHGRGPQEKPDS